MSAYSSFLCACLRRDLESARELLCDEQWNWDTLLHQASDEFILPALVESIQDIHLADAVPREVAEFFSAVATFNAERNQLILDELKTLCQLLKAHSIEPVFLKGVAYIATGVYRRPGKRYLGDIDLLIAQDQIQTAVDILIRNGYQEDESDQFGGFRHHRPPLRRPGSVFIELHDRLGMGPCESLLPAEEVFSQSSLCDFGGMQVKVPAPTHLAMHLLFHSQIQNPYNERIWPPVRAMYDLALIQRRFGAVIDWKTIETRFRKVSRLGLLVLHALQVRETLGLELPLPAQISGVMALRWHRRKILRRFPALRYIDPIYMSAVVLTRRMRVLRRILGQRNGLIHFTKQLLTPDVYRSLATDIIEGRGK